MAQGVRGGRAGAPLCVGGCRHLQRCRALPAPPHGPATRPSPAPTVPNDWSNGGSRPQNLIIVVPVVVLETFKREEPPWSAAGWRIACVCIGAGLDVAVCSLLFPVTTGALMRQRLLGALRQLASLAEGVAACQVGRQSAGPEAPAGAAADDAATAKLEAGLQPEGGDAAAAERRRLQALAQKVGPNRSCTNWR